MDIGNNGTRDRFMDALGESLDGESRRLAPGHLIGERSDASAAERLRESTDRYARALLESTLDPDDTTGTGTENAEVLSGLVLEAYGLGPRVEEASETDRRFMAGRLAELGRRGVTPRFGLDPDASRTAAAWIGRHDAPAANPDPWKEGTRLAGALDRRLRSMLIIDGHAADLEDMERHHDPSTDPMVSLTRSARLFGTELAGDVQADEQPDYEDMERDGETLGSLVLEAYGLGAPVETVGDDERAAMSRILERVDAGLPYAQDDPILEAHARWMEQATATEPRTPDPWPGKPDPADVRRETDLNELVEEWGGTMDDVMTSDHPIRIADRILEANGIDPVERPALETDVADYIAPTFERLDGDMPSGSGTFARLVIEDRMDGVEPEAPEEGPSVPHAGPANPWSNPMDRAPDPSAVTADAAMPAPYAGPVM